MLRQAAQGGAQATDDPEWSRRLELLRRHIDTFRRYQPRPYDQPLLLVRAETVLGRDNPAPVDLGWSELVPTVTVFELPGDHYGVLREPNAAILAGILRRELLGDTSSPAAVAGCAVARADRANRNTIPAMSMPAAAQIERWSVEWLSRYLGAAPETIDPEADFTRFGVNSITVIQFLKDLGAWLGTTLPPTATWKFRTIRALAEHLANGGTVSAECASAPTEPELVEGVL